MRNMHIIADLPKNYQTRNYVYSTSQMREMASIKIALAYSKNASMPSMKKKKVKNLHAQVRQTFHAKASFTIGPW